MFGAQRAERGEADLCKGRWPWTPGLHDALQNGPGQARMLESLVAHFQKPVLPCQGAERLQRVTQVAVKLEVIQHRGIYQRSLGGTAAPGGGAAGAGVCTI